MTTVRDLKERLKSLKENGPSKPSDYLNCLVRLRNEAERFPSFIAPKGSEGTVVGADDNIVVVRLDNPPKGLDQGEEGGVQYSPDLALLDGSDFLPYLKAELEIIGITVGATNDYLEKPFPIKDETVIPKYRFDPINAYLPMFVWGLVIFVLGFALGGSLVWWFR